MAVMAFSQRIRSTKEIVKINFFGSDIRLRKNAYEGRSILLPDAVVCLHLKPR